MRPLALLAAALLVSPALAQDGGVIGEIDRTVDGFVTGIAGEGRLVGGVGVGMTSRPYTEADDEVGFFPIPIVSYQSERFEFIGKTLEAQLFELDRVAFSAVGDWRFQGYDAEDSPALTGMDDRSGTLELGARAKTTAFGVQVAGTALADVLSRHGGYELDLRASFELSRWRPLSVRPLAGVRYQSSSLADYYFGVDPEEAAVPIACPAASGRDCPASPSIVRPAYETGDAVVPFVGVTARQALSRKVLVAGALQWDFLPSDITDSPIVEEDSQFFAFVGLAYAFGAPLGEGYEATREAR